MYDVNWFTKQVVLVPKDHPDLMGFTVLRLNEDKLIYVFHMNDGSQFRLDGIVTQVEYGTDHPAR
jgi:hypothetical protein